MIQFQENARTDRKTAGWKDGQTLFYRTLPATTRCPKTTSFMHTAKHGYEQQDQRKTFKSKENFHNKIAKVN